MSEARRPRSMQFEDMLLEHSADLRRFVERRVSDPELAREIAQEALLRAYRARDAFDPRMPVWPWLATIARNLVRNGIRDEQRRLQTYWSCDAQVIEHHPDGNTEIDPERCFDSEELRSQIALAFETLTERQTRILRLRYFDDMSYDDIAASEGMSVDAVKSLLKRARQAFRRAYDSIDSGLPAVVLVPLRFLRRLRIAIDRIGDAAAHLSMLVRVSGPLSDSVLAALSTVVVAGALLVGAGTPGGSLRASSRAVSTSTADFAGTEASAARGEASASRAPAALRPSVSAQRSEGKLAKAHVRIGERQPGQHIDVGVRQRVPGSDEEAAAQLSVKCAGLSETVGVCDAADALPVGPPGFEPGTS